jgi:hypothetical protein
MKTINVPDESIYPRIIPHELESMRFDSAWKINRDAFRRLFMAEPWSSWIELMRGQLRRNQRSVEAIDIVASVRQFKDRTDLIASKLERKKKDRERKRVEEERQAKRAIKRAVKLHDKLFGLTDVRRLLRGAQVIIEGHHFDYYLTFDASKLFEETIVRDSKMAPTWLEIRNKNDESLGSACLYFDDTAVLDHLMNVKLCASNASAELDMVKGMHITRTTRKFFSDPILPELKAVVDPVVGPLVMTDNIYLHALNDKEHLPQKRIMHGPLHTEAKAALHDMLRFPKNYSAMLKKCGEYSLWRYTQGDERALSVIDGKLEPELFA